MCHSCVLFCDVFIISFLFFSKFFKSTNISPKSESIFSDIWNLKFKSKKPPQLSKNCPELITERTWLENFLLRFRVNLKFSEILRMSPLYFLLNPTQSHSLCSRNILFREEKGRAAAESLFYSLTNLFLWRGGIGFRWEQAISIDRIIDRYKIVAKRNLFSLYIL